MMDLAGFVNTSSSIYEDATTSTANWTSALTRVPSPKQAAWIGTFRYITQVGIAFPIAILGIIGNLLSFIVLCRYKQKSTTRVLLQGLAVTDALNLLVACLIRSFRYIIAGYTQHFVFIYLFRYLYPAVFIIRLAGTWMTVLLTVDRFIAVRFPLHAHHVCTLRRTYSLMALTVLLSSVICIPKFFEYELVRSTTGHVGIQPTSFQGEQVYTLWYRIVFFLFIMYLLPMILLIVLNTMLLLTLHKASSSRKELQEKYLFHNEVRRPSTSLKVHHGGRNSPATSPPNNNHSVTVIVVIVVLVSIVCNVTTLVTHVLFSLSTSFSNMQHLQEARRVFSNVSNVFININSGINFVIYCFCSRNFRAVFKRTFNDPERCSRTWKLIQEKRKCKQDSGVSSTSYVSLRTLSNNQPKQTNSQSNSTNLDGPRIKK